MSAIFHNIDPENQENRFFAIDYEIVSIFFLSKSNRFSLEISHPYQNLGEYEQRNLHENPAQTRGSPRAHQSALRVIKGPVPRAVSARPKVSIPSHGSAPS